MDAIVVADVLRDALAVAIKLSGPMLVLSMGVGVLVAIFQAVTQIHEQTLAFIMKLVIIVAVLVVAGGWMLETLQDYLRALCEIIAS